MSLTIEEANCHLIVVNLRTHMNSLVLFRFVFCFHFYAEPPRSSPQQDPGALGSGNGPPVPPLIDTGNAITYTDEFGNIAADNSTARELPTVNNP